MSWLKCGTLFTITFVFALAVSACDGENDSPCVTLCEAQLEGGCGARSEVLSCADHCEEREDEASVIGCRNETNDFLRCRLEHDLICTVISDLCQGAMTAFESCIQGRFHPPTL